MSDSVAITVTRQEKYRFLVDFGDGIPDLVGDEPPPLSDGAGPSPSQLLAAAVANCLCSSLVFAVAKFKGDPGALTANVVCAFSRNAEKRLRITGMTVTMTLDAPPETLPHLDRALAQFEEFCTVSQSVRSGIPFSVTVKAPDGRVLKA